MTTPQQITDKEKDEILAKYKENPLPSFISSSEMTSILADMHSMFGRHPISPNDFFHFLTILTKTHHPIVDEDTLASRKSQGLPYTILEIIDARVREFFQMGMPVASLKFGALLNAALQGQTLVKPESAVVQKDNSSWEEILAENEKLYPYHSASLVTTLLLLLACPNNHQKMIDAARFQCESLRQPLTVEQVYNSPSESLAAQVAKAKKAAVDGRVGKITVLAVHLADLEFIKRTEMGRLAASKDRDIDFLAGYTTFDHSFVLTIGREGFRLYQGWSRDPEQRRYSLDEWLKTGGTRTRGWDEAGKWVKNFQKLATAKEPVWTPKINDLYRECFGVDLEKHHTTWLLHRPAFHPWVFIHALEDVQVGDVMKFVF
ncbi:hypothetical protein BJX70DRAFT_81808 [Aspergillus crustosus]